MCSKIAFIIQGKHSPHYKPNKMDYKDKCIIVNARYTYLTGKKLEQKLYRHHTGFPGGLKSIQAKTYLEKNPVEMVTRSIKGMLPKNKMRALYLSKVEIIPEGGHNYQKLGLPQFGKIIPIDYNKVFGTDDLQKGKIVHSTIKEEDMPEFLKNMEKDYDEDLMLPKYMTTPKISENTRMSIKYTKYWRNNRFRQYRNIRNKAYRYI